MDKHESDQQGTDGAWAPLIDVSNMSVTTLLTSGDTALARSVQRLVDSLDHPDGIISAFQSYTS